MHIGIDLVDWLILGIGLLASAFVASGSGYCTLELRVVDWPTLGIGNDCFYAAAAISIVVDFVGLAQVRWLFAYFVLFVFFLFLFFSHRDYNKHNKDRLQQT